MAYAKKTWATGDIITADALNNMENGIAAIDARAMTPGPKGDKGDAGPKGETGATGATGPAGAAGAKGADGKSVTAIALTKDANGAITGGIATLSDKSTIAITVTTANA